MSASHNSLQVQPQNPLKRSASKVDDLEEQPARTSAFAVERSPSPKTTRLYDWSLRNPVAFDRIRTRSDSFLLELEKGNNRIEANHHFLEENPQPYPESDHSTKTPTEMSDTTKDPNYRAVHLNSNGVDVEDMTPTIDDEIQAILDKDILRHRENYTALSQSKQNSTSMLLDY